MSQNFFSNFACHILVHCDAPNQSNNCYCHCVFQVFILIVYDYSCIIIYIIDPKTTLGLEPNMFPIKINHT